METAEKEVKTERWQHVMPEGQRCMRELDKKRAPENCKPAEVDYNGCGYWVCANCNTILNDEFDDDYS